MAVFRDSQHRLLVRALFVAIALLILVSGIAIGLAMRQFSAGAAPGDLSACVNNYTGAVRMSPYGVTNCSANETQVSWSGMDTTGLHDVYQLSAPSTVNGATTLHAVQACTFGDVAISGGYARADTNQLTVIASHSTPLGNGWTISVRNPAQTAVDIDVFVVCATP